jgi:hypothetical protein
MCFEVNAGAEAFRELNRVKKEEEWEE